MSEEITINFMGQSKEVILSLDASVQVSGPSGGPIFWGDLLGDISNQSDLHNNLNDKAEASYVGDEELNFALIFNNEISKG